MTQERKDQLFTKMLGVIAEHLSEDGNAPEALERFLGMSREEMAECGVEGVEFDPRNLLIQKLNTCIEQYQAEWLQKRPEELIEASEKIASIRRTVRELPDHLTADDAEYLLRFKNPLEVVADKWQKMNDQPQAVQKDLEWALYAIRDLHEADLDYALEPKYHAEIYGAWANTNMTMQE